MTFLQFFGYYIGSQVALQLIIVTYFLIKQRFQKSSLQKDIKGGKIKMVTMEDLMDELSENKEGKKTWN